MKIYKIICIVLTILTTSTFALSQSSNDAEIDSLMNIVTNKALSAEGLPYTNQLLELSNKRNNDFGRNRAYECKACIYINEDMYKELDAFIDSIDQHTKLKTQYPYVYYYLLYTQGKSFIRQTKYHLAINLAKQMYDAGKDIMRRNENNREEYTKGVETYMQGVDILADSYQEIGQNQIAMDYYDESLKICKGLSGEEELTNMLTSSYGRMTVALDMYVDSDGEKIIQYIEEFRPDLELWASKNKDAGYLDAILPYYYSTIEYIYIKAYIQLNDRKKAEEHFRKFIEICNTNDFSANVSVNYYNCLSDYYYFIGEYEKSIVYADSLIEYEKNTGMYSGMVKSYNLKLRANHAARHYSSDFDIAQLMIAYSDTLNAQQANTSIDEMGVLLGLEKAQQEAEHARAERKMWFIYLIAGCAILIMAIIIVILAIRNNMRQRKANEQLDIKNCELEQQKEEILAQNEFLEEQQERIEIQNKSLEKQNEIISKQNKDVTDSLNYASLIQQAAMPSASVMRGIFGDHLLIYRPLKTVSGDFYWASMNDNIKMIAVGDCTGHGVPGAFLSILGISILNELANKVNSSRINAAEMLDEMRTIFKQSLNQRENTDDEESNHDGIDIALVLIDTENRKMHYAGAFRPLIIVRDGEIIKVDANRMPIGVHYKAADHFTNNEIDIQEKDRIYLFSDGITDQFGYDEKGAIHKFTSKRLYSLLNGGTREPFSSQKTKIDLALEKWRLQGLLSTGEQYEQTDDIVLVGIGIA